MTGGLRGQKENAALARRFGAPRWRAMPYQRLRGIFKLPCTLDSTEHSLPKALQGLTRNGNEQHILHWSLQSQRQSFCSHV
jgi:hypothetical protein